MDDAGDLSGRRRRDLAVAAADAVAPRRWRRGRRESGGRGHGHGLYPPGEGAAEVDLCVEWRLRDFVFGVGGRGRVRTRSRFFFPPLLFALSPSSNQIPARTSLSLSPPPSLTVWPPNLHVKRVGTKNDEGADIVIRSASVSSRNGYQELRNGKEARETAAERRASVCFCCVCSFKRMRAQSPLLVRCSLSCKGYCPSRRER